MTGRMESRSSCGFIEMPTKAKLATFYAELMTGLRASLLTIGRLSIWLNAEVLRLHGIHCGHGRVEFHTMW